MKNVRYVDETRLATELPRLVRLPKRRVWNQSGAEEPGEKWLPDESILRELIDIKAPSPVCELLDAALLDPATELVSNRGKRIRARLVRLGSKLIENSDPPAPERREQWRICAEAIEFLHAGSLVIDDIEDGSRCRRGRPALHVRYGMPLALNAGNWLYFWPLELLRRLDLPVVDRQQIYELYHRTLLRAHFGQALDLGARMDTVIKDHIEEVCLASMRLKTGALMGLAFSLGAMIGGIRGDGISVLDQFGSDFGTVLQMFDDLGNVAGKCEPSKKYEDLMLNRPSWIWASAARQASTREFETFIAAVRALPESADLDAWFYRHDLLDKARQRAAAFMESAFHSLRCNLRRTGLRCSARVLQELRELGEGVSIAYG